MRVSEFQDDLMGRKGFQEKLEAFIKTERHFVPNSLVISLNGKFGSGKSTFLDMWMHDLEERNGESDTLLAVRVNAWDDDFCGDPLVSIVAAMIERFEGEGEKAEDIREALKDAGWFGVALLNQVACKVTGIDPLAAGALAEEKKAQRAGDRVPQMDIFKVFGERKKALEALKNAIRSKIKGEDLSLIVLVDELDRCRPDYAITYLETIKHVFDIRGLGFVLAVDRQQLECSAKAAFGNDLNFSEYYRKFAHREINLPDAGEESYEKIAKKYVGYYLSGVGKRVCYLELGDHTTKYWVSLMAGLKMSPRQCQEAFRIIGHAAQTREVNKGSCTFGLGATIFFLACLKVANYTMYDHFGTGTMSAAEGGAFIRSLGHDEPEWLFTLFYLAGAFSGDKRTAEVIFTEAGFPQATGEKVSFKGWGDAFGMVNGSGIFKKAYKDIESLEDWLYR